MDDDWGDPYRVENTRRSWAMLRPGQPVTNLSREAGMRLLEELQHHQTRHRDVVASLRALVADLDGDRPDNTK